MPSNQQCFLPFFHGVTLLLLAINLSGCTSKPSTTEPADEPPQLTILASKLFERPTYQTYLERINDGPALHWIDASQLTKAQLDSVLPLAHGVVLTGGADIHPERYDQAADTVLCGEIDLERDSLENHLLEAIDHLRIPLLGVCRGLQFMNIHNGGSLHPHLPVVLGTSLHRAGHPGDSRDTTHMVMASEAAKFLGLSASDSAWVTSHHHQGIDQLGSGLQAWAYAPDGLIEGIRRLDTVNFPCYLGIQWHPERSEEGQSLVESIGSYFLSAARTRAMTQAQLAK